MESGRELKGKEEQKEKDSEGERMKEIKGKVQMQRGMKRKRNN
jgi:hypothetical protein